MVPELESVCHEVVLKQHFYGDSYSPELDVPALPARSPWRFSQGQVVKVE